MPAMTEYAAATTLNESTRFIIAIDIDENGTYVTRTATLATLRSELAVLTAYGGLFFSTPAETTLSADTPALAAGTTAAQGALSNVTASTAGRLTYTETETARFNISASLSLSKASGAATEATVYIYVNGSPVSGASLPLSMADTAAVVPVVINLVAELEQDDYVEVYLETDTGDNLTVEAGQLQLSKVG